MWLVTVYFVKERSIYICLSIDSSVVYILMGDLAARIAYLKNEILSLNTPNISIIHVSIPNDLLFQVRQGSLMNLMNSNISRTHRLSCIKIKPIYY